MRTSVEEPNERFASTSHSPATRDFKEKSFKEKSVRSQKSLKSLKSEHSLKTEKSFRLQITDHGMSKQEAALVIQKNYRRYIAQ